MLLVGATLVVSGALQLLSAYRENEAAQQRIEQEQAATAAAKISAFMRGIEAQLRWAIPPVAAGEIPLAERRAGYERLLVQELSITEVRYLDTAGKERLHVSRLAPTVTDSGEDLSRDPRFTLRRAGQIHYGPVYFRSGSEPYVSVAGAEASAGGVTAAEVNLKFIFDVVAPITVGPSGHAYVVDGTGQLIAHPDLSLVLRHTDLSGLPQVREAVSAGSGTRGSLVSSDLAGRSVLAAFERVVSPGWVVFVEQPLSDAVAPVYAVLVQHLLLLVVGLVIAAAASLVLARRMTVPIRALQASAARIGAGDLDHRIDLRRDDELGALAAEFDRMAERLRSSYATLEQKVTERTGQLAASLEENARLLGRIRHFLPPQVADALVSSGADTVLEPHRREITVVFCDLRAFTPFTETAEPEDVFAVLRDYHGAMGELIQRFGGTLEHFAGDGMMAFFNDPMPCPDPQARAVRMALEMRDRVRELARTWRQRGHDLDLHVGVASGYATLGQVGAAGRSEYGAIGSVVNLTSRLCGEAAGGQILVDRRVQSAVEDIAEVRSVGELKLKGFSKSVPAYEILGLKASAPVAASS